MYYGDKKVHLTVHVVEDRRLLEQKVVKTIFRITQNAQHVLNIVRKILWIPGFITKRHMQFGLVQMFQGKAAIGDVCVSNDYLFTERYRCNMIWEKK